MNGRAPSTITVYLSGISALHILNGHRAPDLSLPRIRLALKAVTQQSPGPSKKSPITYDLLSRIISVLPSNRLLYTAMLTLGYYGALRGQEYTATTDTGTLNAPLIQHLSFTTFNSKPAMVFTIPVSKTTSKPIRVPIGCSTTHVCAVCSMLTYLHGRQASGLHPGAYLFVDEHGRPIHKQALNKVIKQAVSALGLNSALYTTHSLRSGAATTANQMGFSETEIQSLGHWASASYKEYITNLDTHSFSFAARLSSQPIP